MIGLILMSQGTLSSALLTDAIDTFGALPLPTIAHHACDYPNATQLDAALKKTLRQLKKSKGVLILTDCYGSTPFNIARNNAKAHHVEVIAGMNLPMLLRLFNYANHPLAELVDIALDGGQNGIIAHHTQGLTHHD